MVNQINVSRAEQFYADTIKYYHPEFSLAVNDPLYDITVRVAKLFKIPEILAIKEQVKANRSLLQASTDTASYDQLLANYFIERNTGSMKYIAVKFIFNSNLNSFRIPAGSPIDIDGTKFITNAEMVVNPSSYVLETNPPYQGKYSLIVSMRSVVSGQLLNIDVGGSVGTTFVPGATSGVITSALGGADPETNLDAFNRGRQLISVRNYVNDRSIKAQIAEKFPGAVDEVQTVGFQDPEMVRDYVLASVPKYQAQLNFSEPVTLNITPQTYRFYYNNRTSITYAPSKTYNISASSSLWQQHPLTKEYFIRIDVDLLTRNNNMGFKQDYPIATHVAQSVNAFQSITLTQPKYLGTRAFLGSWNELDGSPVLIHNSIAATDVYLKTKLVKRTIQLYIPTAGQGFVDFPKDLGPVMKINKILDEQGVEILLYDFQLPDNNDTFRFSGKDQASLFVNPGLVGTTISVELMLAPVVLEVQKEFDKETERLTNADILAKAMYPVFVDGIIQIALSSGSVVDPLEEANLHQAIFDYLHSTTSTLVKSKIIDLVYQTISAAKAVVSLDMAGVQMFADGSKGQILTGEFIKPILSTPLGISERNIQFVKNDWFFVYIN